MPKTEATTGDDWAALQTEPTTKRPAKDDPGRTGKSKEPDSQKSGRQTPDEPEADHPGAATPVDDGPAEDFRRGDQTKHEIELTAADVIKADEWYSARNVEECLGILGLDWYDRTL